VQSGRNNVTFLLPIGLEPRQYHDLVRALVDTMARHLQASEAVSKSGPSYLTLSELTKAPQEGVPVLNDSTWTLSMPVPDGTDLQMLAAAVKDLPGGADIEIESAARYRTSTPET
jgi:hypothetical protein